MSLLLSPAELERRKHVWWAFSELYLDTEHAESWLRRVALDVAAAQYTVPELKAIFLAEVAPAFCYHAFTAGDWESWSEEYVSDQIVTFLRRPWIVRFLATVIARLSRPQRVWHSFERYLVSAAS
jgi:hypothetical protein